MQLIAFCVVVVAAAVQIARLFLLQALLGLGLVGSLLQKIHQMLPPDASSTSLGMQQTTANAIFQHHYLIAAVSPHQHSREGPKSWATGMAQGC